MHVHLICEEDKAHLKQCFAVGAWHDGMRAMHRAVARTYAFPPHAYQASTKVLHHMSYHLPAKQCEAARRVGGPAEKTCLLVPTGTGTWNSDFGTVFTLINECTDP